MKAERFEIVKDEVFVPFGIMINVETKEEAQALYAVFNHVKVSALFDDSDEVLNAITDKYYVCKEEQVIANGVTYEKFYGGGVFE